MERETFELIKRRSQALSREIVGAALEVHRCLGPGLAAGIYEEALEYELQLRGLRVARQVMLPVVYKTRTLGGYQCVDMLVEDLVVVMVHTGAERSPAHRARLLSSLRLTRCWLGLLIDFHAPQLLDAVERVLAPPNPLRLTAPVHPAAPRPLPLRSLPCPTSGGSASSGPVGHP
jgi:GxxExxY protein